MNIRSIFLLSALPLLVQAAADSPHEARSFNPHDVGNLMLIFNNIGSTFNIDRSIERGINTEQLPYLVERLDRTNEELQQHFNDQVFKIQTLDPLKHSFTFIQEQVAYLHKLYQALTIMRTAEDRDHLADSLRGALQEIPEKKKKELVKLFAPLLFQQLIDGHNGDDFIAMGELLKECKNNRFAAIILGLRHQDQAKRDLIAKLIFAQKANIEHALFQNIQADIEDPSKFGMQESRLGRIINSIHQAYKGDTSQYPPSWINTVPYLASGILSDTETNIYSAFQAKYYEKEGMTHQQDLQEILQKHTYTTQQDIKHFISQLERYVYQIDYYRPKWNFTWGVTQSSDTLRYSDHLEISQKMLKHLQTLYPGIVSELDEQIMLHNPQDPYDLMIKIQAQGFEAVLSGIRRELKEMQRASIQSEHSEFEVV